MRTAEQRLDGAVAYRSLVRYDAYGEMSGRQSTSIALLDATRSGLVLSSIHHRDQARLYAKQVHNGQPELELSPEENEAIRVALEGDRGQRARPSGPPSSMRVGYFGPEGTFTHEALIDVRPRPRARARPLPDDLRHGDGRPRRRRRARAGADRELARGLGQRHARRAGDGDRGRRRSSARSSTRSATA